MGWERFLQQYVVNGKVTVKVCVNIHRMSGIQKKKNLRNFDGSMEEWSDVVLVVEEQKFYVSELFLASHSTYFNSLFRGKFKESKKSEVVLKDIKSKDFQDFLEVLHGEYAIDDETINGNRIEGISVFSHVIVGLLKLKCLSLFSDLLPVRFLLSLGFGAEFTFSRIPPPSDDMRLIDSLVLNYSVVVVNLTDSSLLPPTIKTTSNLIDISLMIAHQFNNQIFTHAMIVRNEKLLNLFGTDFMMQDKIKRWQHDQAGVLKLIKLLPAAV